MSQYASYSGYIGGGGGGGGSGTVTSVSVVSAHGFAGTVSNATTTPAITLSTTINAPVLAGNGTAISAATLGNLTDAGTDGITVTGGTGAVVGSGTSLSQHVSDTTHNGYLSSTDWNTFNGKQASGNYIMALTGDVTASGPGSAAATLATVASSGTTGSSTAIPVITINAKGLTTTITTAAVIAPAGTLTGTTLASNVVTTSITSLGTQAQALNMGSHLINSVTDPVSAQDAATKNYVDIVASSLQPIQAAYAATTGSNISGTYSNGAAGIGATFTTTSTSTFIVDGVTPPLASRVLLKDQTSGFQNGVYNVTQIATGVLPTIFTRALDYDTAGDMNAGSLVPIINGTINALTSWLQTATITTVGTDSLVFTEWTANPANYLLKANNLSDVASKTTSFNNISPMTTGGDIIYGGASGAGTRLANGSAGQVLTSNGTTLAPSWTTVGGAKQVVIGTPQTSDVTVTSATYASFSTPLTLSFTATSSAKYRVYCNFPANSASPSQAFLAKIVATTGSPTANQTSATWAVENGVSFTQSFVAETIFTLVSGTPYVFEMLGRITGGATMTIAASQQAIEGNGVTLIAQQIE